MRLPEAGTQLRRQVSRLRCTTAWCEYCFFSETISKRINLGDVCLTHGGIIYFAVIQPRGKMANQTWLFDNDFPAIDQRLLAVIFWRQTSNSGL
jgi:hypothetical protein